MRLEIFILGLTAFFVYNSYMDGKYTKMLFSFKKYYKMIFYALLGIGIYYLLKKNPSQCKNMLLYANNYIKYLPIDKNSMDMLSPIIDFTSNPKSSFMESFNDIESPQFSPFGEQRIKLWKRWNKTLRIRNKKKICCCKSRMEMWTLPKSIRPYF